MRYNKNLFCQSDLHPCWHGPIKGIVFDNRANLIAVRTGGSGRDGWSLHRPGDDDGPGVAVRGFYESLDELKEAVPEFLKAMLAFFFILLAGGVL